MKSGVCVSDLVHELTNVVGADRILVGQALSERVTSFWNDAPMQGVALVFPQTTVEVAAILE